MLGKRASIFKANDFVEIKFKKIMVFNNQQSIHLLQSRSFFQVELQKLHIISNQLCLLWIICMRQITQEATVKVSKCAIASHPCELTWLVSYSWGEEESLLGCSSRCQCPLVVWKNWDHERRHVTLNLLNRREPLIRNSTNFSWQVFLQHW